MRLALIVLAAAAALAAESNTEVPQSACRPGGFVIIRLRSGIEVRGKADSSFSVMFDNLSYQGNNFDAALRSAMASWSVVSGQGWRYSFGGYSGTAASPNDGLMSMTRGGYSFPAGVLAVTLISALSGNGQIVDADTFVNPASNFGTSASPNEIDFESVVLHEMGHALGLDHNDGCYSTATVMQSGISVGVQRRALFPPEIEGERYLYASSGSGGGAVVTASPSALVFGGTAGGSAPLPQSISLSGAIGTAWSAVASSGGNWLSVTPASGATPAGLTVRATTTGLSPGLYTGTVTILAGSASSSVAVSLYLAAPPPTSLELNPAALSFSAQADGLNPPSQNLSVIGTAGVAWTATAATTSGANWLRVSSAGGTLPGSIVVSVVTAGLAPQSYTGRVTVDAGGLRREVPVQLEITSQPRLEVTPAQISLSSIASSVVPMCTSFRVTVGLLALDWTARSNAAWLAVLPAAGRSPGTASLCATAGDLAAGSYTGSVTVSAAATNSPLNISVAFTVTPAVDVQEGGIVNAASFVGGQAAAPGEILSLFGVNLASRTESATAFPLPIDLGDCRVLIGGIAARLVYVSLGQVNLVTPAALADMAGTTTTLTVFNGRLASRSVRVAITRQTPGIFSLLGNGTGAGVITHLDGSPVTRSAPVTPGEIVSVYVTGLGPLAPFVPDGQPAPVDPLANAVNPPRLLLDGQPAAILFAGATPGFAGLQVIVATLPGVILRRFPEIVVEAGGTTSNRVTAGGPSIQTVSPAVVRMGVDATVTITGFNLSATSQVTLAGVNLPATLLEGQSQALQVIIPARLLTAPGTVSFTVTDATAPAEPSSNSLVLTVER